MQNYKFKCYYLFVLLLILGGTACQKLEYTKIDSPAYVRVFNSLNLPDILGSGITDTLPYLCMLINPTFDAEGHPIGAEIVGDFLDRRTNYAPPYPVHIGVSTTVDNPEYPGKEVVLAGPILNGFDLSSWAQVPSGKMDILFMYRPKNSIPFFSLDKYLRINAAASGTYDLEAGEVYTMQVIYDDFMKRSKRIVHRQENFHKLSFSDSSVYVNFYNYSANGYNTAEPALKFPSGRLMKNLFEGGIQDNMDIYLSLYETLDYVPFSSGITIRGNPKVSTFFDRKYLYTLRRNLEIGYIAPYLSFPLWTNSSKNEETVYTNSWQRFEFITAQLALSKDNNTFDDKGRNIFTANNHIGGTYTNPKGNYAIVNCMLNGQTIFTDPLVNPNEIHMGLGLPNLIVSTHSGVHNPRSFATVNTFEIINGQVYLMTLQRKYAAPQF